MLAAINLLPVLVPTLPMGATLPILVAYLVKTTRQIGNAVGHALFRQYARCRRCLPDLRDPDLRSSKCRQLYASPPASTSLSALVQSSWITCVARKHAAEASQRGCHSRGRQPVLLFVCVLALLGGFVSLFTKYSCSARSPMRQDQARSRSPSRSAFWSGLPAVRATAASACGRLAPNDAIWQSEQRPDLGQRLRRGVFLPVTNSLPGPAWGVQSASAWGWSI